MNLKQEVLINQYAQEIIDIQQILSLFENFDNDTKKCFFTDLIFLIIQSKVCEEDIEPAINESKLKPTFTSCVLLKKGIGADQLYKIINLPENEQYKSAVLLLSLFKVAYSRRFKIEKNHPTKWWYQDLSNPDVIEQIKREHVKNSGNF